MLNLVQQKSNFVAEPLQSLSLALGESKAVLVTALDGVISDFKKL